MLNAICHVHQTFKTANYQRRVVHTSYVLYLIMLFVLKNKVRLNKWITTYLHPINEMLYTKYGIFLLCVRYENATELFYASFIFHTFWLSIKSNLRNDLYNNTFSSKIRWQKECRLLFFPFLVVEQDILWSKTS